VLSMALVLRTLKGINRYLYQSMYIIHSIYIYIYTKGATVLISHYHIMTYRPKICKGSLSTSLIHTASLCEALRTPEFFVNIVTIQDISSATFSLPQPQESGPQVPICPVSSELPFRRNRTGGTMQPKAQILPGHNIPTH
jgi:hypothetical protein